MITLERFLEYLRVRDNNNVLKNRNYFIEGGRGGSEQLNFIKGEGV